jgi:hypothetical protein
MGERRILTINENRNISIASLTSLLDEMDVDTPTEAYHYCVL